MWVPLVHWNRIISLFLKVLWKLIYDVYLILLLINLLRSKKGNVCSSVFFICDKTTSKTQRHGISTMPKNWKFAGGGGGGGWCSELRKLTFLDVGLTWNLRNQKGFFQEGVRSIINQEIWIIHETISQVVSQ